MVLLGKINKKDFDQKPMRATHLTLSLREKIIYLGFIVSQEFQICKDFCDIPFCFQDIGITLVFNIFLTVHIFEFFSSAVLQCLKR